jgi:hypothetical protein
MRWERENINTMPVLRNAVCNRQWNQTWTTSLTHRRGLRTSKRQADSKLRLARAFWTLIFCRVRLYRMSHPPAHVCTPTPVTAGQQSLVQKMNHTLSQLYFDHLTMQMMATILYSVNRYKYMPYRGFGIACF